MASSQITTAFRAKTFANFTVQGRPPVIRAMFECAWDYADRFEMIRLTENNWLVFLGEPGCSKTHLSMAVANLLLARPVPVLYFPHVEGIKELLKYFQQKSEDSINNKVEQMKKAPVLIWDDLFKGREKPTDWVLELVFEVINYRYLNLLPTIINSERVDFSTAGNRQGHRLPYPGARQRAYGHCRGSSMQLQAAVKKVPLMKVSFTIPGRPVPKQRPRMGSNGHIYTPKNCREYEKKVAATAYTVFCRPYAGPVALEVNFFLSSRPGDLDNYVKAVSDGLNSIAYQDDRQVVEIKAKITVQSGITERAEVTTRALPQNFVI